MKIFLITPSVFCSFPGLLIYGSSIATSYLNLGWPGWHSKWSLYTFTFFLLNYHPTHWEPTQLDLYLNWCINILFSLVHFGFYKKLLGRA